MLKVFSFFVKDSISVFDEPPYREKEKKKQ